VVMADESKLVRKLGAFPVPVEVIPFGHGTTKARIARAAALLGYRNLEPKLRMKDAAPYRTDNGNHIFDCPFGAIGDVPGLAAALSPLTGVVEHGLFVNMASVLILAGATGVRVLTRA